LALGAYLWDQSSYNTSEQAIVDQEFPDFPAYSSYQMHDVTFTWPISGTVQLDVYFTHGYGNWASVTQARFNCVKHADGNLPPQSYDPRDGQVVPIFKSDLGDAWKLCSYVEIDLSPGTWWIGLTPIASYGDYGQEFHLAAASGVIGFETGLRNPAGGFGYGNNWFPAWARLGYGSNDGAIAIEPAPAEPSGLLLLGLVAALIRPR
jgi:hypothetical protein